MDKETEQALRNLAKVVNTLAEDFEVLKDAQTTLGDYDDTELSQLSTEIYNIMNKIKSRVINELG